MPSPIIGSGGTWGSPTSTTTSPAPSVSSPSLSTGMGGTLTTICLVGIQPFSSEIPKSFALYQNYPNPFNPNTKIKFELPKSAFAKVVVYDLLGKDIKTLVNEQLNAGVYSVDFNGANLASGIYLYKLEVRQAGSSTVDFSETKKMVLIK